MAAGAQLDMSTFKPVTAAAPSSSSGLDMSTFKPASGAAAQPEPLNANPKGEGVYQMQGPSGAIGVPYSKVGNAYSGGMKFADGYDGPEQRRFDRDASADPLKTYQYGIHAPGDGDINTEIPGLSAEGAFLVDKGAARGAALTAAGLAHITQKIVGKVSGGDKTSSKGLTELAGGKPTGGIDKLEQFGEGGNTPEEEYGKFVENAGEFLMGDEALKGLSYLDRIKQVLPVMKVLEKSPLLSRIVDSAIQQGTLGGAQTLVKSQGDVGQAAKSAALTGATAGLTTLVLGGVGAAREAYANRVTKATQSTKEFQDAMATYRQQVADRLAATDTAKADWQTARDQQATEHAKAMEAHNQALTEHEQQVQAAHTEWRNQIDQQKDAHNAAVEAYKKALTDRTQTNAQAIQAWRAQLEEQATKHAADVDAYQSKLADHNQTVAALKNEATTALKTQRQIEGQQGITNIARNATQDGLQRFNEALGANSPHAVDPVAASEGVSTFGDGTDTWQDAARPVYDNINKATEGKFNELQAARSSAIRGQDFEAAAKAETKIDALLEKNPGVKPQEWRAAKSLWADSKDLGRIHNAVEGAFNGISEEMAAQPGTGQRIVKGETLQNRLGGVLSGPKKLSVDRVNQLLGPDGMKGLYTAAHLTSTPELRAATQTLASKVAEELQAMAPTAPAQPEPIAKPELVPKPVAPVKAPTPAAPEAPPKPEAPEKPTAIPKPPPLPRPVRPAPPVRPAASSLIAKAIGGHAAEGVVGAMVGHATGVPYAYAIGGVAGARYVLTQMVTNPKVGDLMKYAVDYGATPERAAKIIAAVINNASNQPEQKETPQ